MDQIFPAGRNRCEPQQPAGKANQCLYFGILQFSHLVLK
jgi:hypothetical protein